MRQFNVQACLVSLLIALIPCSANAVGLGRLSMLSTLGDRLNLEIDLVSVSKEELSTLSARLSAAEAYKQANLQYNPALVGARLSIERRSSGQPYLKITSSRPVNEPFIDVLVEVTSSSGRLVREYTVLVDPPGTTPAQPAPAAAAASGPAPAVVPPVAAPVRSPRRGSAAPPTGPTPAPAPMAGAKEYGPVKQGETLSAIARSVAPEGVTLEQMMVGLYRSNPDAFINKNLNLVRSGRILRVPDKEDVAAVAPADARKEFRAQVADWNTYRQNVAGAPVAAQSEGRSTATGRITTKVEDKAGGEPKDVVRLSRGEPAGAAGKGKGGNTTERLRALEEEVLARDKALAEANERISQLEKTIKELQRLTELKSPGMAAAQQKAEQAAKAKAEAQPPAAPKPEAKAEAPKPEAAPAPKPEIAVAPKPEIVPVPKPEAEKAPAPAEPQKDAAKAEAEKAAPPPDAAKAEAKAEAAKAEKAAAEESKAKQKTQVVTPSAPPQGMMDQIIEAATDPLYLGAGGGLIALGGLAFWMARRRRTAGAEDLDQRRAAPVLPRTRAPVAAPDTTMTMPAAVIPAATAAPAAAVTADEVDPLAEAEVYIAYGRDAQAEEILRDALAKNPQREDVQLKLLEIYSARKDKNAFNNLAANFNRQTGGSGESWMVAAAMGFALDPGNPLYEAGRHAAPAAPATSATASDLDFELGGDAAGVATDITLDSGAVAAAGGFKHDTTAVMNAAELRGMVAEAQKQAESPAPDFSLDIPPAGGHDSTVTETDFNLDAPVPTQDGHVLDFQIELPKVDAPETTTSRPAEAPITDSGLDFKLDIPDLDLGEKSGVDTAAAAGEKDGHWYDVQTKFDLAKAYQEMGDKDGAKEILEEVIKEGDSEQQSQAKKLLETLA